MASWAEQTASSTPQVKFEESPAESFISTPGGDMYPLFDTPSASHTMDPSETVMTPQSYMEDADEQSVADGTPGPDGEKKTKKRKSWGQVLPEPKTNLPPRKRAKTEDEKEQRRVERVLRNRRAAQSSRERKRQEVEALEQRNQELESQLHQQQQEILRMMDELNKFRRASGVVTRGSSPLDTLQPSPITLSQPLFGASDNADATSGVMNDFILMPENDGTVDPASISPELAPVPDHVISTSSASIVPAQPSTSSTTSTDVTQHPAAMLCDPQCPSVEVPQLWEASQPMQALYLQFQLLILMASSTMLSACRRPLTLIAGALKHNLVLQATPSILSTIIWMVTLPPNFRISTSHNSLATISAAQLQARPRETSRSSKIPSPASASSTLRFKSLQKILTSSPRLARPLMDATLGLLRLVSEGCDDRVEGLADGSPGIKGDQSRGPQLWPDGASLPSREVLLTLLWAIRVEVRNMKAGEANIVSESASIRPGSSVLVQDKKTNQNHVLSVTLKRKGDMDVGSSKRMRLGY
ncbi:transcriptional activator hac1 [Xylariales sp. AK1849]|nr:transcriptional activator hac1 [Xylariales sp. AK1849]